MQGKEWLKDLLLIADLIPGNPNEFEKADVNQQVKDIRALGFNTQHVEVNDITVGEAGITFFESQYAIEQRRDKLTDYREAYNQYGGNDIVYFNVHWLTEKLMNIHPEWFQRYDNGEIIPIGYGSGGYSCINSPFREWAFHIVQDIGKYGVKGIFLDGPVFNEQGCYCEACISKFEKKYGFRYTPQNMNDVKVYQKVLAFKHESIAEFVKDTRAALKAVNDKAMIYINGVPLGPSTCGRDNRLAGKWQDALLAEGGFLFGDLRALPIWKPAASAKLLETQAGGKPAIVAIAGRHGAWNRYLLPAAETWLIYAQTIANGGNVWYGIYDSNRNDKEMETVRQINTFLQSNAEYLSNTTSTSNIALVWSFKNANFYQTTKEHWDFVAEKKSLDNQLKSDARKAFNGWFEVLNGSHQLFDIIDDYAVENEDLSKYELIIFPNVACMTEKECQRIKHYVQNGGNIITTYDTSCYNEVGMPYGNLILHEVLGIESVEGVEYLGFDHIEIEDVPVTQNISRPLIPAPNLYVKVNPNAGTCTYMHYREKQASKYCDLPPKTAYPFMTYNEFGKGKAVMLTGNIDTSYEDFRFPVFYEIMRNTVNLLSNTKVVVDEKLTSLNINIRKKGHTLVVHLINHTSYGERPIRNIVPLKKVNLSLLVDKKPKSVKAMRQRQELVFHYDEKYLSVTLPIINEYEILVIE